MATTWGSGEFDVLGLTVSAPPPLQTVFLPLHFGVTVLYGKNGAGKSRLLEAIEASATGVQGRTSTALHLRLKSSESVKPSLTQSPLIPILQGLIDHRPLELGWPHRALTNPGGQLRESLAVRLTEEWKEVTDGPDLATEAAQAGIYTLVANGTEYSPGWDIFVSLLPDERTPMLAARTAEYRRQWAYALDQEAESDQELGLMEAMDDFEIDLDIDPFPEESPFTRAGEPRRLLRLGRVSGQRPLWDVQGQARRDVDSITLGHLRRVNQAGEPRPILKPGSGAVSAAVEEEILSLSQRASDIYAGVLEEAPRLLCKIAAAEDWLTGPALKWMAEENPTSLSFLPLSGLSQAQLRWAEVAIRAALSERSGVAGRALLLIDEPEMALHARAVRHMAKGLEGLAKNSEIDLIVASHAPDVLELPSAHLVHIIRENGRTAVHPLSLSFSPFEARELGLDRRDLLQLVRTFVIVEGQHDVLVIESLCRAALTEARAHILPLRGAKHLRTIVEAQLLVEFTDATFLVVLDAIEPAQARQAWLDAKALWYQERSSNSVMDILDQRLPGGKAIEHKWLKQLMLALLTRGLGHRLEVQTLPLKDILMYLLERALLKRPLPWHELYGQWQYAFSSGETRAAFKPWLIQTRGANFEEARIRACLSEISAVPEDFLALSRALLNQGRKSPSVGAGRLP